MEKRLVIIDGNSLINRAYYAMLKPMITKEGLYTQGVYGFLNMLTKIKKDYEPQFLAVAFDLKAPTFRHLEYDQYKAGRKKMPPELAMQMPLLKEVLAAMNIKMLELEGFEADDIIGTVVKQAEEAGLEPLIITGDRDELQLATDTVRVLITKKGISEFELYDEAAMVEKYGFTPAQFIDYKGLMGDASDNIPGIPGVGEKTAQKLILQFGSVENLLEKADTISNQKLRVKVEENAQLALMSKRLATINTAVPIEIKFEEFLLEEPDYNQLIDVYIKLEFNSFLKKLKSDGKEIRANDSASSLPSGVQLEEAELILVEGLDTLEVLKKALEEKKHAVLKVFSDGNHRNIPVIYGIGIMSNNKCFYVDAEKTGVLGGVLQLLSQLRPQITGHDLKNDYYALLRLGMQKAAGSFDSIFHTAFDTAIAQYVLDPTRSNYALKTMAFEYFHTEVPDEAEFIASAGQMDFFSEGRKQYGEYAVKWCAAVAGLQAVLESRLKSEELEKVYYEVELPLIEVLSSMEAYGFKVDKEELVSTGKSISGKIEDISREIYRLAGEEFNINSPIQLGSILFEKLELPAGKKTKRGYSTGAEVLERLRDAHPIVGLILEFRMLSKLNSTYIEGLLPLIDPEGKIHAHFQQTVTATGRISCTEPNLQNIPIRQELGRKLRKAFIPESSNYFLAGADYSQIELRVLAHMSEDPLLIEAFNHKEDIHRITASRVFGVSEEEVTPLMRSNAKAVNFGVIYGMSGFGLSTELNITRKEAETYIQEYFKKYMDVKRFMDKQVSECKDKGYVKTIMGRKRTINEISASNYMTRQLGERLAMNSPIQGSAADIIKLAMIKVYTELLRGGYKSRLILQVHDELIIETDREEKEQIETLLRENMEQAMQLAVRLAVDLNEGNNWYELK